jgi:epoxyqueuosine reductase
LTIELRRSIPEELREPMGWQVFGCDICQDVCPWNRRAPVTEAAQFQARVFAADEGRRTRTLESPGSEQTQEQSFFLPTLEWLAGMSEKEFRQFFRGSPIKRTKWRGLVRNACIALGNSSLRRSTPGRERILALLEKLSSSAEPLISESARWALSRVE